MNYEDCIAMSEKYDVGAIPVFCRHTGNNTMTQTGADLLHNSPFIAFVSCFEINEFPDGDEANYVFDEIGLTDNADNIWIIDINNSRFGTFIGLDKSFTRNDAVMLYTPMINSENLVGGGYAYSDQPYDGRPLQYGAVLHSLEETARQSRRGLWHLCQDK